jgi:hypothetical protein
MFETLSDHARLWTYGFSSRLTDEQKKLVDQYLHRFLREWNSHGKPVHGEYVILYNRFILIATDDETSGCSIDSSVKILKQLRDTHGLNALAPNLIFYWNHSYVRSAERFVFQELVDEGMIKDDTIVFNMMISTVGALRNHEWEVPFSQSWHNKAFRKSA